MLNQITFLSALAGVASRKELTLKALKNHLDNYLFCNSVTAEAIEVLRSADKSRTFNDFVIRVSAAIDIIEMGLNRLHDEANKMNDALDKEFTRIDELVPAGSKDKFKEIAAKYEVGCKVNYKKEVVEFKLTPIQKLLKLDNISMINDNTIIIDDLSRFWGQWQYTPVFYRLKKTMLLSNSWLEYRIKENRFVAHGMPESIARPVCNHIYEIMNGVKL